MSPVDKDQVSLNHLREFKAQVSRPQEAIRPHAGANKKA